MSSLLAQQPVGPIFRTEKAKSQIAKAREVLVRLRQAMQAWTTQSVCRLCPLVPQALASVSAVLAPRL
eukprot:2964299-Amphidinium_carterae.1